MCDAAGAAPAIHRKSAKEAVPIDPKQPRHLSTQGAKAPGGTPNSAKGGKKKNNKKRRSIPGMILRFLGCLICVCIMLGSVGAVLLVMLVYIFYTKDNNIFWHICIALIIGGGAANLIDRLLNGFVTDYFHVLFIDFPVFNLADCFIVIGCFSLIVYLLVDIIREYKLKDRGAASHG